MGSGDAGDEVVVPGAVDRSEAMDGALPVPCIFEIQHTSFSGGKYPALHFDRSGPWRLNEGDQV